MHLGTPPGKRSEARLRGALHQRRTEIMAQYAAKELSVSEGGIGTILTPKRHIIKRTNLGADTRGYLIAYLTVSCAVPRLLPARPDRADTLHRQSPPTRERAKDTVHREDGVDESSSWLCPCFEESQGDVAFYSSRCSGPTGVTLVLLRYCKQNAPFLFCRPSV